MYMFKKDLPINDQKLLIYHETKPKTKLENS